MRGYNFIKISTSGILPKITLFALIFCFFPWKTLYSLPPQKLLHPDDWAYEAIAILSREQGRVFFVDSRITVAQMEKYLEEIDAASLSGSGLAIYDRLAEYLKSNYWLGFESDVISGGTDIILQPEFYYKSNENNPWIYNDHPRSAVLQLPWGFSFGSWITAEMDLYFGQNEYAATFHDNYINIPLDSSHADLHFPKRAYVSSGISAGKASGVNFAIGIGDNFFGKTQTGSIVLSEHLERTIYAEASFHSPAFKYTAEVMQYEVNKYHYMHYLRARPHKSISISITEGVMVNAPLELRFLNPFTIFHGYESYKTYTKYNEELGHNKKDNKEKEPFEDGYDMIYESSGNSRIGSYLGVKLEWQPVKYLRLYGLMAMTQYQLPIEKQKWQEDLTPDALGFQAGFDLSIPVKKGYWDFGIEGVYTYPYLYVLWDKSWSFYKEVPEVDNFDLRYWTGTPFGPDTIAGALRAGFRSSTNWYAGISFVFSAQGERSGLTIFDIKPDKENINNTYRPSNKVFDETVPPTGIPVYTYTTTLRGEYYPKKWLSFIFQPGYRITVNAEHEEDRVEHGFEFALSARFKPFSKKTEGR